MCSKSQRIPLNWVMLTFGWLIGTASNNTVIHSRTSCNDKSVITLLCVFGWLYFKSNALFLLFILRRLRLFALHRAVELFCFLNYRTLTMFSFATDKVFCMHEQRLSFSLFFLKRCFVLLSAALGLFLPLHHNCPNSPVRLRCWCKICWLLITVVTGHSHREWLGLDGGEGDRHRSVGLNSSAVGRKDWRWKRGPNRNVLDAGCFHTHEWQRLIAEGKTSTGLMMFGFSELITVCHCPTKVYQNNTEMWSCTKKSWLKKSLQS